jgi:hypothetical protein
MRLFIILFCLIYSNKPTPTPLTVKEILISADKARAMVAQQELSDFMNELNYRLPIVKEVGLKYGTDDFTNSKRQYSANFGVNTLKSIKAQEDFKAVQLNLYKSQKDVMYNDLLKVRYLDMVEVYFAQSFWVKQQFLDTLLNQKITVLKTSLQKGIVIKIKDLAETEDDIKTIRLALIATDNRKNMNYDKIKTYMRLQNEVAMGFENFITVGRVESVINSIKNSKKIRTPELEARENQINLSKSELKIEEANFHQWFDGFQVIYQQKSKTDFSPQDFSFRVGLNIPIKGNFRPKQNELLIEAREATQARDLEAYQSAQQIQSQLINLDNLLKQYRLCEVLAESSLSQHILNTPAVVATLSATDIIDLKILQAKKSLELIKIKYDLFRAYIELLGVTGELIEVPRKNYLSNVLEKW